MACRCGKRAATNFSHLGSLCKRCFSAIIEKRVRRELRNAGIRPGQRVLVMGRVAGFFARKILTMPLDISVVRRDGRIPKGYDAVIVPWTLDDEVERFLQDVFSGRQPRAGNGHVKLFRTVTRDELSEFCMLNRLRYSCKKNRLGRLLDRFSAKYPETKFSLLKSIERISKLPA
ncbi:MAG: hypothetical protein ABH879_06025 [archaeon]